MKRFQPALKNLAAGVLDTAILAASINEFDDSRIALARLDGETRLLACGRGGVVEELNGLKLAEGKVCELSTANRQVLQQYLSFLRPACAGTQRASIGLGDRLGRATAGHIAAVMGKAIFPVFAQQSIRELNLTGRNYNNVLDDVVWAVLQAGWREGFGADGDHLKTIPDIKNALELGFSMITLDCSEKIDNTIQSMTPDQVAAAYQALPKKEREYWEKRYLNQKVALGPVGSGFSISGPELQETVLIYKEAIDFMVHVWKTQIALANRPIDFEISIDETTTPTSLVAHWIVAQELAAKKVGVVSVAPRFCGEFQKGVDYQGDLVQFEREFAVHAAIAEHFGYKISVHSGSDKFSVFPIVARLTSGRFHVKTAGTNWLEAVKVIAAQDAPLYRAMHRFALDNFAEAKKFYHVTTDLSAIRPLDQVTDDALPGYLAENNARQLLHITYGLLLNAKDQSGNYVFRDRFFADLTRFEAQYRDNLVGHIGRHLQLLGK